METAYEAKEAVKRGTLAEALAWYLDLLSITHIDMWRNELNGLLCKIWELDRRLIDE